MRKAPSPRTVASGPLRSPTARDLVTTRSVGRARQYPDFDLSPLDTEGLSQRDTALACAIDQCVARRWLTLVAVLQTQLDRPWEQLQPGVQAALLVGAAQLFLLERLPNHAVVHEAVEWTKVNVQPRAGGLVNAVLHRVADLRDCIVENRDQAPFSRDELPLHDGRAWQLKEPVFDADPLCRLGQQTSHPPELLRRWKQRFGRARTTQLALHSLVHPPIIVAGLPAHQGSAAGKDGATRSSGVEAQASRLPVYCEPHEQRGFAVFHGSRAELQEMLAEHPQAWVQDPGSAAAAGATAGLVPNLIVDVCAGRGTKTRQLAELHPQACIIATDIKASKLELLKAVFRGHNRVRAVEYGRLIEFAGTADLVVLDVPCSNTAALARRVEAKYRFSPQSLGQLVNLQRQIIADSIGLLAPCGNLLYSTCSLEAQENEQQTGWIQRWHRMRVHRHGRCLPEGLPGDPPQRYCDGSFFALLGVDRG